MHDAPDLSPNWAPLTTAGVDDAAGIFSKLMAADSAEFVRMGDEAYAFAQQCGASAEVAEQFRAKVITQMVDGHQRQAAEMDRDLNAPATH